LPAVPVPSRLVLLGAGGHASDVLGVVEQLQAAGSHIEVVGVLDDDHEADMSRFAGREVQIAGPIDRLSDLDAAWIAAVGWPSTRRRLVARTGAAAAAPALVSPRADVGRGVVVGDGSVVMGSARLSPLAHVGEHALVSYAAAVGHDSIVGDGTSVMPGAMVSGGVRIGEWVLVGTNATVIEGVVIGDGATVGAGAVVLQDVPPGTTVAGVPARAVR
jgi:sugar O-acyltransferase (sialic acid O-acetyltransferase NeuD family)